MISKHYIIYILLLIPSIIFGQLTNFTLNVSTTDETCLGNGTLTFNSTLTTSGSAITYYVYKLPDITNAVAVQTTNLLEGQTSGTYQITAIQVLGSEQNSQTTTATIINSIVPLAYTITSTSSICNDGVMSITITNGIGSKYEIISGPIVRPIQTSPIFTNLPSGVYQVRVYDNCDDATVITHTLTMEFSNITIGDVGFPNPELPSCNSIFVSNSISVDFLQSIRYPLDLTYNVHFPDGSSQIITNTISTGQDSSCLAGAEIPFFYDQEYNYDLTVVDDCGQVFVLNNNIVNQKLEANITLNEAICGAYFLTVDAKNYRRDLQVQFTTFPAGFDPSLFNIEHPGPFQGPKIDYGNYNLTVPYGDYTVVISDSCGHTATTSITLEDEPSEPYHTSAPLSGCQSNISTITIKIPRFTIVSAIIIVAPIAYGNIPRDVSNYIDIDEGLVIPNLITGNYTIVLTDECGNEYIYDFFVQDVATSILYAARPGCELGKGSLRIKGNDTILTSVIITSAPAEFTQTIPYNASSYITTDGAFSMGNLFPGQYSFTTLDNCGIQNTATIEVVGYSVTTNNFTLTPHCGSFDLNLFYFSNAVAEYFWLQKLNPITNAWGNPQDGTPYIEGTTPTGINSHYIEKNIPNLNLTFLGTFRIIKSFQTFGDGNIEPFVTCLEIIQEFDFNGEIQFTGIEKVNCNGTYMDVKLYAIGAEPLHYSIILKDGFPFFVDNGANNVFTNLEPAIYTFRVDQLCGDSRNFISDVAQLPSLAIANQPNDMFECDDISNDQKATFILTNQNADILGSYNQTLYTITYHSIMNDAVLGINPLPNSYFTESKTIYARLKYTSSTDCYDVVSFNLFVIPYQSNPPINISLCENQSVTLTAESGFVSYNWSTGETTESISVYQSGQYILDVVQSFPLGFCTKQFIYNVTTVSKPVINYIEIVDWADENNSIEVILESNNANYEYSLDNMHFQQSNFFTDLDIGYYTVYVRDINCGSDYKKALILNYPKYFTPNGDGYNDYWRIKFSEYEPNIKTLIFDRFGKLITSLTSESNGWDGKLNGHELLSDDYWFLVIREDGRNLRGHFSMKR